MNKRLLFLIVLAVTSVGFQGLQIYQTFFNEAFLTLQLAGFNIQDTPPLKVTMVVTKERDGLPPYAHLAGLKEKDEVVAIFNGRGEGGPPQCWRDFQETVKTLRLAEPWKLVIKRPGTTGTIEIRFPAIVKSPAISRLSLRTFLFLSIIPLIAIATAFFIGFMKPDNDHAFTACLLFLCFSSIFSAPAQFEVMPGGIREMAVLYHLTLNNFLIFLFLKFFLLFPSPSWIERKFPWLKTFALASTIFAWLIEISFSTMVYFSFDLFQKSKPLVKYIGTPLNLLFLVFFLLGIASLILNTFKQESKDERRRMVILLTGTLVSLMPLLVLAIYFSLTRNTPSRWVVIPIIVSLSIFPLSFVYVVLKHRVMDIRLIIRRGLQYAMVSNIFLALEGVLIFIVFLWAGEPLVRNVFPKADFATWGLASFALVISMVLLLRKLNRRVMPIIDRRFFRDAYNAQQILADLGRAVRQLASQPEKLMQIVTDKISDSLYPDQVAIFLRQTQLAGVTPGGGILLDPSLLPPPAEGHQSYTCYRRRVRVGQQVDLQPPQETLSELSISGDTSIARHIEQFLLNEPEALDVYLDDPRSWAGSMLLSSSTSGSLAEEKDLLKKLNTRLILPLAVQDGLLGFISLGEKLSEEPYTGEDKKLLMAVAEQTAVALDYAKLIQEVAEQEKLKREIEIAKEVQTRLFPQILPPMKTLDYMGLCRPARGVGGDYYDFVALGEGRLGIALGDISGKGISAALLMAGLQAMLRSHASLRGESLETLVAEINRQLYESSGGNKYATFFYGVYDDHSRTLTYVNAGHNPPILFRGVAPSQKSLPAPSGEMINTALPALPVQSLRLETGGTVVGIFPEYTYHQETIRLLPGDILVIYSDGISEAMDVDSNEFGEERLKDIILAHRGQTAAELCQAILYAVEQFVGTAPQHDDMTLVVAKIQG